MDAITTSSARAALAAPSGAVALLLCEGEKVSDPRALEAFAASGCAAGVVTLLVERPDALVERRREVRLVRGGAVGIEAHPALADQLVVAADVELFASDLVLHREKDERGDLAALRAAHPADPFVALRLAETLATSDPATAVVLANETLDVLPLHVPDARAAVLALARALHAGGGVGELLGLAAACRDRFPRWPELALLEALAHGAAGDDRAMLHVLGEILEHGDDPEAPGLVLAASALPYFHLGALAEKTGDARAAATFYTRAGALPPAREALARLASGDAAAERARPKAPARLHDDGVLATKRCRHGTFTYPVTDRFVGRALDLYGEWCEAELEALAPLLGEGAVVVDVGANLGTHTVFFAKAVGPRGRVVAFEPQRSAFDLLAKNVADNGLENVVLRREAVGARPGEAFVPVIDPRAPVNFGAVATTDAASGGDEAVPRVTVDDLRLERCDLLKIDVEGAEHLVLEGARETIRRHEPVLFVENNTVERSAEVLAAVEALGYRAYWHIAPYYSATNFFGNPEDVFAPFQPEANLVCVPKRRAREGLPDGLLEVEGPTDDFTRALARRETLAAIEKKKRPFTLVVCIPGREFSGRFFDAWHAFAERCRDLGIRLILSRAYDAVVYYARNRVLGGDVRRGPKQAPWGGEVDYDYMLWIDSDVVFEFEHFQRLLAHKVEIAAGLYLMADDRHYAAVEHMDEARFQRDGAFEFLTPDALASREGLVRVDYCGFGFVLVRRGVFERLEYPWFRPIYVEMGGCREFTSEDVGFCMLAKQAGIPVLVDPKVVVGHEKSVVLEPSRWKRAA